LYHKLKQTKIALPPPEPPLAADPRDTENEKFEGVAWDTSKDPSPCDRGGELGGDLGLKETLATALVAARMNDIAVFESLGTGGDTTTATVNGQKAPSQINNYAFGQIGAQIDFTIVAGINGGPNWTLTHFKGPIAGGGGGGGGGQGLFNFNRQAKDTLLITFLPVCIRQKYVPVQWERLFDKGEKPPKDLSPLIYPTQYDNQHLNFGTPGWANYLPPCNSPAGQTAKIKAPSAARMNNENLSIQRFNLR
jgi:hypothetical protein